MRALATFACCGLLAVSLALAQGPGRRGGAEGRGDPQAQLNSRFEASGLAVGKAFPAVDIHDASGKAVSTSSLKGSHTLVVSGCLT